MRTGFRNRLLAVLWGLGSVAFWGCPAPPAGNGETSTPISNLQFTFLQAQNRLYFAAGVRETFEYQSLDTGSVRVVWHGTAGLSTPGDTLTLVDNGLSGDILARDGLYSRKTANSPAQLTHVVAASDTGFVTLQVLAAYGTTLVSVTDSFTLGNLIPRILEVSAPDTIVRPAGAGNIWQLVSAEVQDANGLDDIRLVGFSSFHADGDSFMNRGALILLYDDGGEVVLYPPDLTSGDAVRGDGTYSFTIPIFGTGNTDPDQQTKPGRFDWTFEAQDQAGEYAEPVVRRVVVE